jgi:tetratricopeptide (TPR) repeat protein
LARVQGFALAAALVVSANEAHALCGAARNVELKGNRASAMAEARQELTLHGEAGRAHARALYIALLARDPNDDEVTTALARIDSWDGCSDLAERGYRAVLLRNPNEVDARGGLIDILLWQRRWEEAEEQIREGLRRAPQSADLLSRRARLSHWRGDESAAIADAESAARLSPYDPTLYVQRDALFLGEARIGVRGQFFPGGYDDIYTFEADGMQRYKHFRFEIGHRIVSRTGAFADTTATDGRRSGGVYYHFRSGGWAGLELAYAAPPIALPRYALTLAAVTPIATRVSVGLNFGVWSYATDKTVYIVAPAVNYAVRDGIEIGLRYWVSTVVAGAPGQPTVSETVHSAGIRTIFTLDPSFLVGGEYTFGVQLDQNPTLAQFLQLRSHILTGFARKMFTREIGVSPVVAFEVRENTKTEQVIVIPLVEAALLVRW